MHNQSGLEDGDDTAMLSESPDEYGGLTLHPPVRDRDQLSDLGRVSPKYPRP